VKVPEGHLTIRLSGRRKQQKIQLQERAGAAQLEAVSLPELLLPMKHKKTVTRYEKIPVRLSIKDRDLVLEHTLIDTVHIELLKSAKPQRDAITVYLTLEDLDDILGYIAFEANHTDDPKLEATLDQVYDRLTEIESMYVLMDD
jgi:hypothetical protein